MSYFFHFKITSTLTSNREYHSSSKKHHLTVKIFTKHKICPLTRQYAITNVKYTKQNPFYVNFNKHKREYVIIPIWGY